MTSKAIEVRLGNVETEVKNVQKEVSEVKTEIAVLNKTVEVVAENQKEIQGQVKSVDDKMEKLVQNGIKRNGEVKLQGYKLGIWGWVIRVIYVATAGAVLTYLVKLIFKIRG